MKKTKGTIYFTAGLLACLTLLASCSKPPVFQPVEPVLSQAVKKTENLDPNGFQTYQWTVRILNNDGLPVGGTLVNFSVEAINPLKGWRDVDEVAARYGSSAATFRKKVASGQIRLLGTVSPQTAVTDSEGYAATVYTASHIGSNTELPGQEKIIAASPEKTESITLDLGYQDLVPVPLVEGGLRISGATGRYVQQAVGQLLFNLGTAIKTENWPVPLTVTAAGLRWGGLYPPHFMHRRGGTLDFRPMSTDGNPTWCNTDGTYAANYDRERTMALIKIFFESGAREILFNDPQAAALGAKPLAGHHNHLHVSWLADSERDIMVKQIRTGAHF